MTVVFFQSRLYAYLSLSLVQLWYLSAIRNISTMIRVIKSNKKRENYSLLIKLLIRKRA